MPEARAAVTGSAGRTAVTGPRDSPESRPATEQPGNSFRYLYWRLSKEEFQQLCSALLRLKYGSVRCFPVGMADEGFDAVVEGSVIFQVKWSSKLLQDPAAWLAEAVRGERPKIMRLVQEKQISRYVLMTSVAGTTGRGTGSIHKLKKQLDRYGKEFGVPVECWWQSNAHSRGRRPQIRSSGLNQEMLAGSAAMRYLIHGSQTEGQAARMRDTVLQVIARPTGDILWGSGALPGSVHNFAEHTFQRCLIHCSQTRKG